MASEAKVKLVLQGEDRTTGAFSSASKGATGFGKSIKGLLPILGVAGLAGAIGGVIQATANFEQQLSDVATLMSGDSTQAVNQLRSGIQELLKETPKKPEELGAAAYQIVSAGISDTGDALKTLKASTKLAVAGLGSTEEATTLLVTAVNAFGKGAEDADNVADVLFKTVKAGQTNVQQLSQAFGKMAGNAAAANLTLEEVQAATAAITTVTGKTSEAQNALAQVFLELTVTGGKLDKSLQDQGGSLEELNMLIQDRGGVVQGFEAMRDKLGLTDTQFKNMFSSAEGGTAVFQLLTSANDAYNTTLESMQEGVNAIDEATRKQNEQFNAQFQILKNNVNVEFQQLAIQLLPSLIIVMETLVDMINTIGKGWDELTTIMANNIKAIEEWVSAITGAINTVGNLFGTSFKVGGFELNPLAAIGELTAGVATNSLLGFAEGGMVPGPIGSPQLAVVHGGEEVIPVGGKRGGQTIVINMSGNTFLDERSADKIGNLLVDRLRTQFRF